METKNLIQEVTIPVGNIELEGNLSIPEKANSLVIFSHGSGSSRFSPRNNMVAEVLQQQGMGTLLFDLLTAEEDAMYANRFDIDLLTQRLVAVTRWVKNNANTRAFNIGFFGASTGAASALNAAAELKDLVQAIVSRGGRPDLSLPVIDEVKAPVLLIVGERDYEVIEFNRQAFKKLTCEKSLKIIPGATHLFEEPGKLEEVARLSAEWFEQYF